MQEPELQELSESLRENQVKNSRFIIRNQQLTGEVRIQSFEPSMSLSIIDRIDAILAHHYGLNEVELDFIRNRQRKYRLGKDRSDD